ncbi:hypothetical protein J6590_066221 [Homalodisca vitripennis]|nr:hypothetical protein J6590_066221 [Homalodisca vitripennis]
MVHMWIDDKSPMLIMVLASLHPRVGGGLPELQRDPRKNSNQYEKKGISDRGRSRSPPAGAKIQILIQENKVREFGGIATGPFLLQRQRIHYKLIVQASKRRFWTTDRQTDRTMR